MKKINLMLHSVAALAVAAFASACSSDVVSDVLGNTQGKAEKVTIVARQPGNNNTRVGFDENGKGYWQANDAIGVWSNGDSKFNSFSLASGAGETSATFSGTVTNGVGTYAVYPYNENDKLDGTSLTYHLPEKYVYTSVDQTFFPEGKDGNSFCMPMFGTISGDNVVSFKHLGGVICLQIDKMPAESGTVKVTEASNQLCGSFTANLSDATPEIVTAQSATNNSVTFVYSGATVDSVGIFYLPAATGNYNLTVQVSGDKKTSSTKAEVTMKRSRLQVVNVKTEYVSNIESADGVVVINGHRFIDMGLPSGTLWAETNIGAETAYDEGDYFAWGETKTKESYTDATYAVRIDTTYDELYEQYVYTKVFAKYNDIDKKTELDKEDDAAYVNWGTSCRMPTETDYQELMVDSCCTCVNVTRKNSLGNEVSCLKVVSKKNGNIIYLPNVATLTVSPYMYTLSYWTSSVCPKDWMNSYKPYEGAYYFYSTYSYLGNRSNGCVIRPVAEP